jgi:SAM-dependent methyltransferase
MTFPDTDSSDFHDFEHAGWERAAEHYGDAFGALTAQTAPAILDAVHPARGTRLLDVATGPGFIARAAADRGADVVGLDFASAMVTEARRRHPTLTFREGDAEALPFDDSTFDAVVMNFGLLHLARPDAAIAESRRVLRPGGRYAFTVWASPERAAAFGLTLRAIEELGNSRVPLPEGPPFFRFSDAAETRRTLEAAGFSSVDVQELALTWRLSSPDACSTPCRAVAYAPPRCCARRRRWRWRRSEQRSSARPSRIRPEASSCCRCRRCSPRG